MKSTFAILADMYLNPKFAAADINKERGVIIEEIMMYKDQPQHLVQEILGELLWQDHALGRPLIGTTRHRRESLAGDILDFKNTKYVADNTVVVFAGQGGPRRLREACRGTAGACPRGRGTRRIRA